MYPRKAPILLITAILLFALLPFTFTQGNVDAQGHDFVPQPTTQPTIRGTVETSFQDVKVAVISYDTVDDSEIGVDEERLTGLIRDAAANGSRLVVTPEVPLHKMRGLPREKMEYFASLYDTLYANYSALADELDICLVVGLVSPSGDEEKPLRNTAIFFGPDGKMLGRHYKMWSAEGPLYLEGVEADGCGCPFTTPIGRVGLTICIDTPWIYEILKDKGVDLFISIYYGLANYVGYACENMNCYALGANHVRESSYIIAPNGTILQFTKKFETLYETIPLPVNRYALVETSMGKMGFELAEDMVPFTVDNFERYVGSGFYDGLVFHEVKDGGVIMSGRYDQDLERSPPTYPPVPLQVYRDMWNTGNITCEDGAMVLNHPDGDPDNGTCEFFICDGDQHQLDGMYSPFGRMVKGHAVLDRISSLPVESRTAGDGVPLSNVPTEPVTIGDISILSELPDFSPFYMGDLVDQPVYEDTVWEIDLSTVFTDDEDPESLTYSCNNNEISISGTAASWSPVHGDTSQLGVVFTATDTASQSTESPGFDLIYVEVNDSPSYEGGLVDASVPEDTAWEFDLTTAFSDEETPVTDLTFSCNKDEITINGSTAGWTPATDDASVSDAVITVSDGNLTNQSLPFTLTCSPANDAPVYLGGLADAAVVEESIWSADLTTNFTDEENPAGLVFTCSHSEITVTGGQASWTPDDGAVTLTGVVFNAADGNDGALKAESDPVTLTFVPVNDPPSISALDPVEATEDVPLTVDLADLVTDPDTTSDSLEVETNSEHVEVDGMVLTLLYGEGSEDEDVAITVTDGELSASAVLSVAFVPVNDPPDTPTITSPNEGDSFTTDDVITFTSTVSDPDNVESELTVTCASDIDGDLGDGAGVRLSAGTHTITVTATDSGGLSASATVTITVQGVEGDGEGSADGVEMSFGPVYASDGKTPLAGAEVMITYPNGTVVSGTTGTDGIARISAPPGEVTVDVLYGGETVVDQINVTLDGSPGAVAVPPTDADPDSAGDDMDGDDSSDGGGFPLWAWAAVAAAVVLVLAGLFLFMKYKGGEGKPEDQRTEGGDGLIQGEMAHPTSTQQTPAGSPHPHHGQPDHGPVGQAGPRSPGKI